MAHKPLPELPAPLVELPKYISQHPEKPVAQILEPYRQYEASLRSLFAQDGKNPVLQDPHINVLPLFTNDTKSITTRARDLSTESAEEKSKYMMPLAEDKRRANGSPATVSDLSEFQKNFNVFSESSLAEMNWDNVVAAGSSVVNCLLPVPDEYKMPKRKLREYYHEKFCPASDVDLFLYGLKPEDAIEKIKQIEQAVRDVLLNEVTVVRTRYAVTIASQYPVRHIQIVLRVYSSVSEILTGFDIDAAGGAYDGKQVYVTPRALGSFITQINHIDLSRRSPSYENRLSKYSHRNFERSFQRTLGLARLLVLESLPTTSARQDYLNKRRRERGRPIVRQSRFKLGEGNIKDDYEDEVADWLSSEEVSNYHTFSVPYGQRFDAKRIEKLCYTRDLLLNAEWNQNDKREVYLHRHPAFFGRVEDIIEDCCGYCPEPITDEEKEVAERESQIYISGKISFLIDDPGRQQIGSFNPLTEKDWTDMAYIGDTARLCQSIVDDQVDEIKGWTSQIDADINKRDYTGRTPLHLAVISSTPDVVRCLVESGARITARLADGRTALHLAAARNNTEMIKILLDKSAENEEADADRVEKKRRDAKSAKSDHDGDTEMQEDQEDRIDMGDQDQGMMDTEEEENDEEGDEASYNEVDVDEDKGEAGEDSDGELIDSEDSDDGAPTETTGSFVKLKRVTECIDQLSLEESDSGPDYYDIDVLAWDVPCSPLHLAIAGGHEDAVKALCDYGADSILPVKFLSQIDDDQTAAILTLTLALSLPSEQAISMTKLLLTLGAISSQADANGATAFHRFVDSGRKDLVDTLLEQDRAGVKMAINHMVMAGSTWDPEAIAPLHSAIERGDSILVLKLLNAGAEATVKFDAWLKAAKTSARISSELGTFDTNQELYRKLLQPLFAAVQADNHEAAVKILESGADPNSLNAETLELLENESDRRYYTGMSILDTVESRISKLQSKLKTAERALHRERPEKAPGMEEYLDRFDPNTYRHWAARLEIASQNRSYKIRTEQYEEHLKSRNALEDAEEVDRLQGLITGFTDLKEILISRGAKTFAKLHPNIKTREKSPPMSPTPSEEDHAEAKRHFISFRGDNTITEKRREGYIQLMEAAFAGNLDEVKSLTMQAWGPEQDEPPLLASIRDTADNGPFSLAFFRGHHEVAKAILEIVKAQWSPKKQNKTYRMKGDDSDDEEDDEEENSEDESDEDGLDNEPDIVGENMDKKYTIDDLGQLTVVKCHVTPSNILEEKWKKPILNGGIPEDDKSHTVFQHCVVDNDVASLNILIDIAQYWAGQTLDDGEEEETHGVFTFPELEYRDAIQNGHTELASLMIKHTGAGIPLNSFIKGSGIKLDQKPKFYQGLTVYGKKRKDWANKGRNMIARASGLKTPPLLYAALGGSLESVQFFLSDVPHRLYTEFSKTETALLDPRIQHLTQQQGAFDRAVGKWLGIDDTDAQLFCSNQADFIIHCAIVSPPKGRQIELLHYLVKTCPSAIEKKDSNGNTPLMNAAFLGRVPFVKILIEANADQSVRNSNGENIIHRALDESPKASEFRSFLELLDSHLLRHLFLQRKSLSEDGSNPVHSWISKISGSKYEQESSDTYFFYGRPEEDYDTEESSAPYKDDKPGLVEMLQLLLESSKGEGLEMFNGAGDTCLHTAVMNRQLAITKTLIEFKPSLIYRENAVGRTPLEVARDIVTASKLARPRQIELSRPEPGDRKAPLEFGDENATPVPSPGRSGEPRAATVNVEELGLGEKYSERVLAIISWQVGLGGTPVKPPKELTKRLSKAVILDFCATGANNNPMKRRLVSLNEANDVARRLGEMKARAVKQREDKKGNDNGDEDDNKAPSTEEAISFQLENAKRWSKALED
ncbi:unnamed protein product [Clonostachys solani]|uniref:Ankyrin repeat protein n=1 Tax=Clonostachys solani TaxID=160281 RepID=A0A9N9Z9E5_9HYPO|nr:unnamed protein product [Clonostachys solani]